MPSLKELREKRGQLKADVLRLRDVIANEGRDFTAHEQTDWDRVNNDYDGLSRQIENLERAAKIERELADPAGDERVGRGDAGDPPDGADDGEDRNPADKRRDRKQGAGASEEDRADCLVGWLRAQQDLPLKKRHLLAAKRTGVNLRARQLKLLLPQRAPRNLREAEGLATQKRAMSAISGPAGGYLTPPASMVAAIEVAMITFNPMRSVAQVIRTESGEDMPWPTANDTSNEGELLGENKEVAALDLTVGRLTWKAHKYSSKMVLVPVELLEDSAFDVAQILGEILGERIARRQNRDFTTGDGAAKPRGVVTASTLGVTAASTSAIAADELIKLEYSVEAPYRQNAAYMMHDAIIQAVRLLKDGQGRYLWQPSVVDGQPDRFNSYQVVPNNHMDSTISSGKKTVLYGEFAKYKIRDVRAYRLRRLVERYAEKDQEGFIGFQRSDGNLLDAGTAPIKHLVH